MAESTIHINLVASLVRWIAREHFQGEKGSILVDSPDSTAQSKPPSIGGFVPDVYCEGMTTGVIIGEAKTSGDLENRHTREQVGAYLKYLSSRAGSVLVLAVPWHLTRYTRNLVRVMQVSNGYADVRVVVLEKLEG